ncbi:MAG TPA: thioredoxin [Polyangiaceae bacterium]|nr:thioredoxin [Polyangiaceae bacterium]
MNRFVATAVACLLALACKSGGAPRESPTAAPEKAARAAAGHVRPEFVRGPSGGVDVAPFVADELRKGKAAKRGVLVYVGATWCEPCQAFHHAVQAGELDDLLDGVRLLEFDLDADRDALGRAGYSSRLIPLFALPNADGTGSDRRIEGSVKGPAAVEQNLMPRLREFLRGQAEN